MPFASIPALDMVDGWFATLPIWAHPLLIVAAIAVIGKGAQWVVDSSSRLASRFGISELIIGLTVVAFGTSAPEFAVTLIAAFQDKGDISVGNIVGSNIFNLGFILGGVAMVRAIPTTPTLLYRDGGVLLASTLLVLGFVGYDLKLDHLDGAILFGLLLCYLAYLTISRKDVEPSEEVHEAIEHMKPLWMDILMLLGGLVAIVLGSQIMVGSASEIARAAGVSDWVIAVTIVAAGTSAPEFATSLVGVLKGRYGISAGNLIGSDIFNVLGVLGVAGMLRPVDVDPMARVSLAVLCLMVLTVLVFMRTGWKVSRLEGLLLFVFAGARWWFDFYTHQP